MIFEQVISEQNLFQQLFFKQLLFEQSLFEQVIFEQSLFEQLAFYPTFQVSNDIWKLFFLDNFNFLWHSHSLLKFLKKLSQSFKNENLKQKKIFKKMKIIPTKKLSSRVCKGWKKQTKNWQKKILNFHFLFFRKKCFGEREVIFELHSSVLLLMFLFSNEKVKFEKWK